MRIYRRADYRRMPWKNGGGLTEEIATDPPGADMERFDWRLSIAHVERDGPFSRFPGIDRSIALLGGGGMVLEVDGVNAMTLMADGPVFVFAGEAEVASRNLSGPTMDLNIMTRRGRLRHVMRRVALPAGEAIVGAAAGTLLVAMAAFDITVAGVVEPVAVFDTVHVNAGERVDVASDAAVIRIDLEPVR